MISIVKSYFEQHPDKKDGVIKAWYAYHAPHFRVEPDMPLHNFTSSQKWSRCVWCDRSREEVRHDNLSGRCLNRPSVIMNITDVLKEEGESFLELQEKGKEFIPKFVTKHGLNGETLAILHHTYGYEPETVSAIISIEISLYMNEYEKFMDQERALSKSSHKKEIITVNYEQ